MIRVYFGHHKCASQYIKAVFLQATALLGLGSSRSDALSQELPLGYHLREPFVTRLAQHRAQLLSGSAAVLCLTNADAEAVVLLERYGDYKGFHVIRDPRDILVSAYFSHRYSHPQYGEDHYLAEFRRQMSAVPDIESGLLLELEFSTVFFRRFADWDYLNPHIYETRYETLIADPASEFARIFHFLGVQTPRFDLMALAELSLNFLRWRLGRRRPVSKSSALPQPVLRYILNRNAFTRQTHGRQPGEEDTLHHYRKGVPGDWRSYFTPRVISAFKDQYGDLLIDLGYESSKAW